MTRWMLLLVLALFTVGTAQAQAQGQIAGTITSDTGQPLAGVSVAVQGTTHGAVTDAAGRYSIANLPAGGYQLRATLIGYAPRVLSVSVAAGQVATLDFTLQPQAIQLEEIVAVGYGTQRRRDMTGAVASVKAAEITQVVTSNPIDAIKGRLPGVDITTSSFEPGAAARIRIRGARSMTATNDPLYVVDGVPISGDLRDFDSNSIESIEVLRDASATAIYGSRGANGVLLITTKRGESGRTRFSYNTSYGAQSIRKRVPVMNGQEYADFRRESYRAVGRYNCPEGTTCAAGDAEIFTGGMGTGLQNGTSTDWQDLISQTGHLQNHQLSASGGNETTRFHASFGYLDQKGVTLGDAYDAKTAALNLTHDFGRLNIQVGANLAHTTRNAGRGGGVWEEALYNSPLGAPYDTDGKIIFLPTDDPFRVNPISEATNNIREIGRTNVLGTVTTTLEIAEGLKAVVNFGPQYSLLSDGVFVGRETRALRGGNANAGLHRTQRLNYTLSNYLQLDRQIGADHRLNATLLYEIQQERTDFDSTFVQSLPYEHQRWYNLGTGSNQTVKSWLSETAYQSYMMRVNYSLRDRYTLTLTGRVDGSSRMAEGHKYAVFPAAALGWQLSEEPFLERQELFSNLRLRASYGRTGNSAINPYQTQGQLSTAWYSFGSSTQLGYQPGSIPNPDLRWETTDQYNIGMDFGLLGNRIAGTADYYIQNTHDLLLLRALPYTSGFANVLQNVGETRNQGFEVSLSTLNLSGWNGLSWITDLSLSTNDNKIVALAEGKDFDVGNLWWVGKPINVYFDYRFLGIWQNGEAAEAAKYGQKPGDIRVADINGDGKIDGDDRVIIGRHFNFPKWQGSLNNRFDYKRFDLSVLATARLGYTINSAYHDQYINMAGRFNNLAVDYWTPTNPSNLNPRPNADYGAGPYGSSRSYKSGSHLRIRDITLGYTVPPSLLERFGSQSLRVYFKAQEPLIFTSYDGFDPEAGFATGDPNSAATRIDSGSPPIRTFMFGAQVTF